VWHQALSQPAHPGSLIGGAVPHAGPGQECPAAQRVMWWRVHRDPGAWWLTGPVSAGMVTLFVVIAIAVSHTGQTTPLGDGPSRTAARYTNICGLRQSWAATKI